ncbi:FprA family A-type flavoprotein [uncultured Duncaniella sp.]|uniref:FprA family A-type flavoprotein n=1 Tax=uncultured Duncaniella sp. TaxID=2768039 RepID=UPI00259CA616|nr:FprA family A-type flavoprotein [uncultured Duncaniella sp.]
MKVSRISDHIHYIGVNDRTTSRFEAMWPLPYGVSYNSYLITGADKTAIVDGVEACYALRQIEHIRDIIGDRKPDYLIINHMEPDHSGAIKMLRDAYPDIVIVGNAQTLAMVNGFYGVADKTLAVKDGDTLSLGADVNLRFTLTPMVHWPETMMTYFVEEETLFSGDAFGCFGALAGAVVDSDMDTSRYFPEMVRYYSSIVGKYGLFVQKALRKFDNVAVRTLCTTHGPVWRDRISEVVGIYDRLSLYEPLDNGVTVIYGSMYGNTELMAETAAEVLAEAGIREIDVHNASVSDLSFMLSDIFRHRGLVIAAPTYSDTLFPPVRNVMEAIATRGVKNRDVLLIGSCTWGQKAVGAMNSYIESIGAVSAAEPIAFKQAATAVQLQQCRDAACALAAKLLQ